MTDYAPLKRETVTQMKGEKANQRWVGSENSC